MDKKKVSLFLTALALFSFLSVSIYAFGELQNTQYQTVEYNWLKGLTSFSIIPPSSGCTEKYETTATGRVLTQYSYPLTIKCDSYGANYPNYFCKVYTVTYGANYDNRNYHTTYAKIDGGQSATMGWYGDYGQLYQQYVVDYYSWKCPVACTPNWQCGNWGSCQPNNQQTRTCSDNNNCGITINKPSEIQTCTYQPACTQIYQCGIWDVCQPNNQQTRTCTIDSCGKTNTETGGCTYIPPQPLCTPTWQISLWGDCQSNNQQTRTVTDLNNCGVNTNKPSDTQTCTYKPISPTTCNEGQKQQKTCPDGKVYDAKNCINNEWKDMIFISDPCLTAQPPVPECPKERLDLTTGLCRPSDPIADFFSFKWLIDIWNGFWKAILT